MGTGLCFGGDNILELDRSGVCTTMYYATELNTLNGHFMWIVTQWKKKTSIRFKNLEDKTVYSGAWLSGLKVNSVNYWLWDFRLSF